MSNSLILGVFGHMDHDTPINYLRTRGLSFDVACLMHIFRVIHDLTVANPTPLSRPFS